MRIIKILLVLAFVSAISVVAPQMADAQETRTQKIGEALIFDPFPKGVTARVIKSIWLKVPAYKAFYDEFEFMPEYMTAGFDLNGDGIDEIFARHSNAESTYCDEGITCLLHIYALHNNQALEIGRIMAAAQVIPMQETSNGLHDLLIQNKDGKLDLYRFDGKTYTPANKE